MAGAPDEPARVPARTPYTAHQVELLTVEVDRIAWAIDPMGPPSERPRKSWLARAFDTRD